MSRYHDQMFRRAERVKAKIRNIYSNARHFCQSHDQILEQMKEVYESRDYKKLSPYYVGYLMGMVESIGKEIYQTDLEWRVSLRGRLIPSSAVPDGSWSEVDGEAGKHVWRKDPSKAY